MGWYNEMVLILRHLINDLDSSSETYDDDRLEETLIVAAQLIMTQIDFDQTYTIDVDLHSISPDPTLAGSKDDDFINLTCIKAATIIIGGEAKVLAKQSFTVKDGPSSISVKGAYDATRDLLDKMNEDLALAIQQYKAGNSVVGKAILSPYTSSFVANRRIF